MAPNHPRPRTARQSRSAANCTVVLTCNHWPHERLRELVTLVIAMRPMMITWYGIQGSWRWRNLTLQDSPSRFCHNSGSLPINLGDSVRMRFVVGAVCHDAFIHLSEAATVRSRSYRSLNELSTVTNNSQSLSRGHPDCGGVYSECTAGKDFVPENRRQWGLLLGRDNTLFLLHYTLFSRAGGVGCREGV